MARPLDREIVVALTVALTSHELDVILRALDQLAVEQTRKMRASTHAQPSEYGHVADEARDLAYRLRVTS